jgi:hypothetical protein
VESADFDPQEESSKKKAVFILFEELPGKSKFSYKVIVFGDSLQTPKTGGGNRQTLFVRNRYIL